MTKIIKDKIKDALTSLNNNYGKGDIIKIDFENMTFVIKPYRLNEEVRKFSYKNNTVYALRHQRKIN